MKVELSEQECYLIRIALMCMHLSDVIVNNTEISDETLSDAEELYDQGKAEYEEFLSSIDIQALIEKLK